MSNNRTLRPASGLKRNPCWHSCMGASLLSPSLLVNCTLAVWQSPPTSVVNYPWKALRGVDSMRFTCTLCLLGISVSYDRVENLINGLASTECNRFKQDGVACPLNLTNGLLTFGALDDIDHNPSSTTAQGLFHGTGRSLFRIPSDTVIHHSSCMKAT